MNLNRKQADDTTLRDHLESVYRQTDIMDPQLVPVECPSCILYLWEYFCELSGGRQMSEAGPGPISYREIKAWSDMTGNALAPWEVETVKRIDAVYLKLAYAQRKK
jgi:hypothetical protein